jgi:hypothetical protein
MQFAAPAEHYDRVTGRYAPTLEARGWRARGIVPGPKD